MTRKCAFFSLALLLAPLAAAAAPPPQPVSRPPRVLIVPNQSALQFQQAVRQQQVVDQLNKNQLQEQLRQQNAAAIRRPFQNTPSATQGLDAADAAARNAYQARQQSLIDQYNSQLLLPAPAVRAVPVPQGR